MSRLLLARIRKPLTMWLVSVYVENYSAKRASVYFCYYVFTAAIQHVSTR